MKFRFIECSPSPPERFALDEVAMTYAGETGNGAIVFYRMKKNAVSLGRLQSYPVIRIPDGQAFDVVRRPSSGSSVVHNDLGGDFSYTVALPFSAMKMRVSGQPDTKSFRYEYYCRPLQQALASLDIPTNVLGHNYVVVGGGRERRIVSSNAYADRRLYKAGMVHGYVNCNEEGKPLWDTILGSGSKRLVFASEFGVPPARVYGALREAFSNLGEVERGDFTPKESGHALELVEKTYGSEDWTMNAKDSRGLWTIRTKPIVTCADLIDERHPLEGA